jgi:hypothetical protein
MLLSFNNPQNILVTDHKPRSFLHYGKRTFSKMTSMHVVLIKDDKGPVENLYIGGILKPKPGVGPS